MKLSWKKKNNLSRGLKRNSFTNVVRVKIKKSQKIKLANKINVQPHKLL